jgi:hypothetical protein
MVLLHSPCTTRQLISRQSPGSPLALHLIRGGMSPSSRHTQASTSQPGIQLCRARTSVWEPPHHPQPKTVYFLQDSQKAPLSSPLIPSSPISAIYLVPLYLLILLLAILSAVLINYLITLESCNTLIK